MSRKKFCVIGLGYFGYNLSLFLAEAGAEVLSIDIRQDIVDRISERVTHTVCMDSTDRKALASLGLNEMDAVIVAIGEGFESSIMTTALLQEFGVKKIYNRVISPVQERILKLMKIDELLVPEAEAASHLSNRLMIEGLLKSFEISNNFGIYEVEAPKRFAGKTLLELNLRQLYSLNLVTIKRIKKKKGFLTLGETEETEVIGVPTPDLKIMEGDILVLFCGEKDIKNLLNE